MSLIRDFINKIRARRNPPVINSPWGPVSEAARLQACANMNADPRKREQVLAALTDKMGGDYVAGEREFRRRYPEVKL